VANYASRIEQWSTLAPLEAAQMLQLLEPYAGQRGRVIRLLGLDGNAAPKFGPRQRIQPMHRR
jgi:hypothetical protein